MNVQELKSLISDSMSSRIYVFNCEEVDRGFIHKVVSDGDEVELHYTYDHATPSYYVSGLIADLDGVDHLKRVVAVDVYGIRFNNMDIEDQWSNALDINVWLADWYERDKTHDQVW